MLVEIRPEELVQQDTLQCCKEPKFEPECQPLLEGQQPEPATTATTSRNHEFPTSPRVVYARVPRDALDLAEYRRRRERMLVARWNASAPARAELAPVLNSLRDARAETDLRDGVRLWVKGFGKGTHLGQCHGVHTIEFDSFHGCRQLRLAARTRWSVLPPRHLEAAFRRAMCPAMLPHPDTEQECVWADLPQVGSVQHYSAFSTLSRRNLAQSAEAASQALDPLTGLSRRAKRQANVKNSWSAKRYNRHSTDCNALSFPIPSIAVADAVDAARRRLKQAEQAADEAWAAFARAEKRRATDQSKSVDGGSSKPSSFDALRDAVLAEHKAQLQQELGDATTFTPVALAAKPREAFMQTYASADVSLPTLAYHGTRSANFRPIAEHGLVVPGSGHGVVVANGSAHGVGIYTAKLGSHYLSLGFCDSSKLLVCGVIDAAVSAATDPRGKHPKYGLGRARNHRVTSRARNSSGLSTAQKMGRLTVHRDVPGQVRHVGNAMVIFQARRVAPLFVADVTRTNSAQTQLDPSWMWQNGGNPNVTKASVCGSQHKRQVVVGVEVWFLPPGPVEWCGSKAKEVQRRRVAKKRNVERRHARAAKLRPMYEPE